MNFIDELKEYLNSKTKDQVLKDFKDSSIECDVPFSIMDVINKSESISGVMNWVAFDFMKIETRPKEYGRYLITRKDGKIHWETWNGSGWAYNHNEIRYWAKITPPCL